MSEVRCPMCGKPNPADQEICKFCQARLLPLQVTPSSEDTSDASIGPGETLPPKSEDESGGSLPDWLNSLRQQEEDPEPLPESGEDETLPDWLRDLRERSFEFTPESDDELPKDSPSAFVAADNELSEWLETPSTTFDTNEDFGTEEEAVEASDVEDSDWLSRIISGETTPAEPGESDGSPEWLKEFEPASMEGETGTESSVRDTEEGGEPSEEGVPDWLAREMAAVAPQAFRGRVENEDWESQGDLEGDEVGGPLEKTSEAAEDEEEEFPDWLSDLEGEALQEEPAHPAPESGNQELPDWLTQETVPASTPENIEPLEDEEKMPDWLSELDAEAPDRLVQEIGMPASGEYPAESSDEADSLDRIDGSDELHELTTADSLEPPAAGIDEGLSPKPAVEVDGSMEDVGDDLSWLDELEAAFQEMPSEEDVSALQLGSQELEGEAFSDLEPVPDDELPDWLFEEHPEAEEPATLQTPADDEEGLAPADLPNWLEAMRPVAAVGVTAAMPDDISEVVSAGPLAGLRGVLPAEPDIAQVQKPPAYSLKLNVTDLQRSQAELIAQLLKSEGRSRPVPGRPAITSQRVLRISIAIVLILAILLPLTFGIPQVDLPGLTPQVTSANQLVSSLAANAPVLLAFDYEPGLSGEMEAVAAPVVDHLMIRGAYLVLVSTVPTGPLQAERLIAQVNQSGGHQYNSSDRYVNLGFVPGGPAGLLGFAETPQQILPTDMDGNAIWTNPYLQGVDTLSKFKLIVVATEKSDTARAWVEQVRPILLDTPLVVVASAQLEPVIYPYYETIPRQVHGMVGGLAGGASYETLQGRPGNASGYWASFSTGLVVGGLLIILGGSVNVITSLTKRDKRETLVEDGS